MERMKLIKFVGEVMGNPGKFSQHVHFSVTEESDGHISGFFRIEGPLVPLFKELKPNAKSTLEEKQKVD